jgi:hypothetical protein
VWIPPQALAQMQAGQQLDFDPVSRTTTSVTQAGPTVGIEERNGNEATDPLYDRSSGVLLGFHVEHPQLYSQFEYRLIGQSP